MVLGLAGSYTVFRSLKLDLHSTVQWSRSGALGQLILLTPALSPADRANFSFGFLTRAMGQQQSLYPRDAVENI